jgi:hypothetical protein
MHYYLRNKIIRAFLISGSLLCVASPGYTQTTTGKVSGRIVVQQSGQPLFGVNVVLKGTTLGAATDADGDFFIINIPPGRYNVQASMVGFALQSRTDVLVQIERTVVVDFQMGTQTMQGEEVTISADHEIIKMDISGSTSTLEGEEIVAAPVTHVADYLKIQDGVEFERTSQGKWLSIRGGERDETDFILDGQTTMSGITNIAYMAISKTAIREVSVQTGGFNAEYGRVRSGLVNVVTRDGSRNGYSITGEGKYSFPHLKHFGRALFDRNGPLYRVRVGSGNFQPGKFQGTTFIQEGGRTSIGSIGEYIIDPNSPEYRGFFHTGNGYKDANEEVYSEAEIQQYEMNPVYSYPQYYAFEGWKALADAGASGRLYAQDAVYPVEAMAVWAWEHQGWPHGHQPDYDMDVTLTGPLPGERMNNKLGHILATSTFMLSYRTQTSRMVFPTARNSYKDKNLQAKITSTISPTTKLRLSALYGEIYSLTRSGVGIGGQGMGIGAETNTYYTDDGISNSGEEMVSGMQGGMRLGNSIDRGNRAFFSNSTQPLGDQFIFNTSARLTHMVSPSTYFEMEYQFSQHVWNYRPMWDTDTFQDDWWIFNIDGLVNERGEPRTFTTTDPNDIFINGIAQYMDPLVRRQEVDASGDLSLVDLQYVNGRDVIFSNGGYGTWPYTTELLTTWYDQRFPENSNRKGPNREHMVLGFNPDSGELVDWVEPALLPGKWEWPHPMNTYNRVQDPYNPANGGLLPGETLPGITLVHGQYHPSGFRWGPGFGIDGFYQIDAHAKQINRSISQSHGGRVTIVSQLTKHNQIKAGLDFRFWNVFQMFTHCNGSGCIFSHADYSADEVRDGADIWDIRGNWDANKWQQFDDNPFELSAYLQDKIEVQGLIANIGVRMDVFDPTTSSFDFSNPYRAEFANSGLDDPDEFRGPSHFHSSEKVKARPVIKVSPRLGLSFPVTETSKVYFNYGWFYQRPPMQQLFQYTYWEVSNGVAPTITPNSNLDWPRTIQMEMGYEQNIKGWFLLHAAGYYKDSDSIIDTFTWQNAAGDQLLQSHVNNNYFDVRGLEFRADKNYGLLRARINFNYMLRTRGQSGASRAFQDLTLQLAERESTIRSITENRPQPQPSLRGTLGFFSPRNWGLKVGENIHPFDNLVINLIYQWRSRGDRRHIQDAVRSDRDIWVPQVSYSNTDLRAQKEVHIGQNFRVGAFLQVFNLWNQKLLVGPNGNYGIDQIFQEAYTNNFRYDTEFGSSVHPGKDTWGEYKPQHLRETLPWFLDTILFDDKRDVFYGMTVTWN